MLDAVILVAAIILNPRAEKRRKREQAVALGDVPQMEVGPSHPVQDQETTTGRTGEKGKENDDVVMREVTDSRAIV